jgi:hypothetical protein
MKSERCKNLRLISEASIAIDQIRQFDSSSTSSHHDLSPTPQKFHNHGALNVPLLCECDPDLKLRRRIAGLRKILQRTTSCRRSYAHKYAPPSLFPFTPLPSTPFLASSLTFNAKNYWQTPQQRKPPTQTSNLKKRSKRASSRRPPSKQPI